MTANGGVKWSNREPYADRGSTCMCCFLECEPDSQGKYPCPPDLRAWSLWHRGDWPGRMLVEDAGEDD